MERVHHVCRLLPSPWPGVFATDIDSNRQYDRHWHTTFGVGLMARGAHRSLSGRGLVDALAGDTITTNPGEVHDGRPLGGPSRRWLMFFLDAPTMAAMAGPTASEIRLTRPVLQDRAVHPALQHLWRQLERWNTGGPARPGVTLACEEALVRACGLLLRHHSTAAPAAVARTDMSRVRERLADDLVTPPSLAALAAMVGLTRYQLLRRFERVYGMTPFEWQRQVRVERARALIGTGRSLVQVAAACGFADQSHMTRAFASHFGFTPGAWADMRAAGRAEPTRGCNHVQDAGAPIAPRWPA